MAAAAGRPPCLFCQIARGSTSTDLHYAVRSLFMPFYPNSSLLLLYYFVVSLWDNALLLLSVQDEMVVAFRDINPSAVGHYLVVPVEHIPTVKHLRRRTEDYHLVNHMLNVGKTLLARDAPESMCSRFGFHQPPFNSIDHLHLHCLALPFIPRWRQVKYTTLGPFWGFIEAEKLLDKIRPFSKVTS
ncbi:Scavenger mRNA decapping enzyme C-term binding [Musa troglodytarum]|uniref:Scavenger mRNA decapping enzyme C-term binding n=1 Tax=Musa troglodytarum TaxID=320322 RepID=A0A9E7FW81_9LILI|nr:Scavenger mRNA decapping enzyme C-term binding [Musa troglodytarum]